MTSEGSIELIIDVSSLGSMVNLLASNRMTSTCPIILTVLVSGAEVGSPSAYTVMPSESILYDVDVCFDPAWSIAPSVMPLIPRSPTSYSPARLIVAASSELCGL